MVKLRFDGINLGNLHQDLLEVYLKCDPIIPMQQLFRLAKLDQCKYDFAIIPFQDTSFFLCTAFS